ncbi:TPA: hypothetical protein I4D28_15130 [Enterobacter hormaechei]|nr:hypothetical protein [Enterobacter hormaechei]
MRWPAWAKSPVALTLAGLTEVPKANALACMGKKPGGADAYRAYRVPKAYALACMGKKPGGADAYRAYR